MAILAGIDEAGYGPLLGPLVVSCTAFRVPDKLIDESLWHTLRASCTQTPHDQGRRLAVADSKMLYHSKKGLALLERAALVMLAATGKRPASVRDLLVLLAPDVIEQLHSYPWYGGVDRPLPVSDGVGDVGTRANSVARNCRENGIQPVGTSSEVLLVENYNRLVKSTRNKAVVLLGLVVRLVDRILRVSGGERVRLCVDRLGGRMRYRDVLMTSIPGYDLRVLEESSSRSAYRLVRGERTCDVEFVTGGEKRHFAVALASVYSKYVRELFMREFNDYWGGLVDGLRPTAGYYTDAKRWLVDAAPTVERLAIPRRLLVRDR